MARIAGLVDAALEWPVAPSFTTVGYRVRSRLGHFRPLASYDLTGRVMVITGATSGLGRHAAITLARCGASLVLVGRDQGRLAAVADEIRAGSGSGEAVAVQTDMGELDQVRSLATDILGRYDRVDAVLHNAGALSATRRETGAGIEATVASQVLGPFLLTGLLLPVLGGGTGGSSRVITMSSGGMYTAPLTVGQLQMSADTYRGSEQYARAKRAQVTLNELWARHVPAAACVFHAVHPGWADTPGVAHALPQFHRFTRPLLRTPAEGADTMEWLAADDEALASTGGFWLDRHQRPLHRLGSTRRSDTPERRAELWAWCVAQTGLSDLGPALS